MPFPPRPAPFGFGNSVEQALAALAELLEMMLRMELKKAMEEICAAVPTAPPGVTIRGNIAKIRSEIAAATSGATERARAILGPEASALESVITLRIVFPILVRNFRTGGPMDFKQRNPQFENFGNFNFGAVGRALELSRDILFFAAGLVQVQTDLGRLRKGRTRLGEGTPFTGFPHGDSAKDQEQILAGSIFFDIGCI